MLETFPLPTGYLFYDEYERGRLETLSIGDYGKKHNVKAQFLGLNRDIEGVPNIACMPLQEKWVVTLSTQYGCPMKCTFCDVPNVQFQGNATRNDLMCQLQSAFRLFPSVKYTERLNIHFARMGEPIFNEEVFRLSENIALHKDDFQAETGIRFEVIHPVLTTSLPRKLKDLRDRIFDWAYIKNSIYNGQAGLQFSINSTNDDQRDEMFAGMSVSLDELSVMVADLPNPVSRKYCLNFAYATDYEIDAKRLKKLFDPNKFMVKITPIHNNNSTALNGIQTVGGYDSFTPYAQAEKDLINEGFDVLIFVPSIDEEDGLVTCGNAILGGSNLKLDSSIVNIEGIPA